MRLRPAQQKILEYRQGKLAVSAVPGSGKTFTLSKVAANILANRLLNVELGQSVLIVTYLNSTVEHFRAGIRRQLMEMGCPVIGFDVRTIHSLAYEITQLAEAGYSSDNASVSYLDASLRSKLLSESTSNVINQFPNLWSELLGSDSSKISGMWRRLIEDSIPSFISAAKNHRYKPESIAERLDGQKNSSKNMLVLKLLSHIYLHYQQSLARNGFLDFDDMIWRAISNIEADSQLQSSLADRWPFVLEDEAQDSIPLQERLLGKISEINSNWVRVGDPNQAIMSTFTASYPEQFINFLKSPHVIAHTLVSSGRCAPKIIGAANALVSWACDDHPLPTVRSRAFLKQMIQPTPDGDVQPNPSDENAKIEIKVFIDRDEDEIPQVALIAKNYVDQFADHTAAILVPTNFTGQKMADSLTKIGANFEDRLTNSRRGLPAVKAISSIISLIAQPGRSQHFAPAFDTFIWLNQSELLDALLDQKHVHVLLNSIVRPEDFLFPASGDVEDSLPNEAASSAERDVLNKFSDFLRHFFLAQPMAYDELILRVGELLFTPKTENGLENIETYLAISYQLAAEVRGWTDHNQTWRLPEIADRLKDFASGRAALIHLESGTVGYEPKPGKITLSTQHSAKGMEWDAVFLTGLDSFWLPSTLEDSFVGYNAELNGDPKAEIMALLAAVMNDEIAIFPPGYATDEAHIEVICERLRLFYVGITRAKRYLHLSRSTKFSTYYGVEECHPSKALELIYRQIVSH